MTDGSNGDYDSDTMLITDNKILIDAAERNYDKFLVPTNMTSSVKKKRVFTSSDKADLDVKTSVNKIGEIINLSQQLNSLMWERINKGQTPEQCSELYCDICKLAVLSNVEIDRAKREFVINSMTEINTLKKKYKISDDGKCIKPMFFKMITTENGYKLSDNIKYRYFNTAMDHLQRILSRFNFRENREQKRTVVPFMDMIKRPDCDFRQTYYYNQRDKIINAIKAAREEQKKVYAGYDLLTKDEKDIVLREAYEIKQSCIETIEKMSSNPAVMFLTLRTLDSADYKAISRFVFEILFGRPDQQFFTMIKDSKEDIYTLQESQDGYIKYYDFCFEKVLMAS